MKDISYQLYSSREFPPLEKTLSMLKGLGYTQVEGYGGLYGDPAALGAALQAAGLAMPSGHFGLDMLENEPDKAIAVAQATNMRMVICPYLMEPDRPGDAAGWRAFGARLEKAGQPFRDAGLTVGWHNHDFEFRPLPDGGIPLQHILDGGPTLAWEADIAWIARGDADPLYWIDRYGDRIAAAHVKDIARQGENSDEDGWADVGHGVMDWKALLAALKKTEASLYVMEHDKPNDDERFARRSIASLKALTE